MTPLFSFDVLGPMFFGLVSLIVYQFIIRPYLLVRFYRKQGIPMFFSPIIGSYDRDEENAEKKGDYYYDWIKLGHQKNRPKAVGKNVASDTQLYLIDPKAIEQFFINHEEYIKHPDFMALMMILQINGLAMLEGRVWRDHRKILGTAFQFEKLQELFPEVLSHSQEIFENLKKKDLNNIDIFDEFRNESGEIVGRIFFEQSLEMPVQGKPLTLFLSDLISRIALEPCSRLYLMFGMKLVKTGLIPRQRKILSDIRESRLWCQDVVRKNMTKRREDYKNGLYPYTGKRLNMFDHFFNYELANPTEALTEDELIDEFIAFFADGIYTNGHFITMCTYYLAKNPEWMAKVIEEMDRLFPKLSDITFDGIQKMDILGACMKETFRLAPPAVTAVERIALHDHDLAGIKIKKGTILTACHSINHLDERFFEDPYTYNPDRWLKPSKSQESVKQYPSIFLPFSMGPRRCIGQNFGLNKAKVSLTIFLRKYRYELVDKNYELKFVQRFLREPLDPIIYKLIPREGTQ